MHEYCELSIYRSRTSNDIETARKGRKRTFTKTKTKNSENTHHTSLFRTSHGVSPLSSLQRIHSEISRVHCTVSWKTDYCIFIKMSLKFVPKGTVNNVPVLVQILDYHSSGNKPLLNHWWPSLLIYVSHGQWVNFPYKDSFPLAYPIFHSWTHSRCKWEERIDRYAGKNTELCSYAYQH